MRSRYATLAALTAASLLLSGCAVLREFKPAVEVAAMTPGEYITLKRGVVKGDNDFIKWAVANGGTTLKVGGV